MEYNRRATDTKSLPRKLILLTETVGLALVFVATLVAMGLETWSMIQAREVVLGDLLLLFIFLEVVSMIGIYYKSHRVPVRYPIYIAMTALSRYLILDAKSLDAVSLMAVTGAILLLAIAVLAIRFGQSKYPYQDGDF